MATETIYPVPTEWAARAKIDRDGFARRTAEAATDPDRFWRGEAQRLDWMAPFTRVKNASFAEADFGIKWFEDGTLNVSANCLDRHAARDPDAIAILWEGDDPDDSRAISYGALLGDVCRLQYSRCLPDYLRGLAKQAVDRRNAELAKLISPAEPWMSPT